MLWGVLLIVFGCGFVKCGGCSVGSVVDGLCCGCFYMFGGLCYVVVDEVVIGIWFGKRIGLRWFY